MGKLTEEDPNSKFDCPPLQSQDEVAEDLKYKRTNKVCRAFVRAEYGLSSRGALRDWSSRSRSCFYPPFLFTALCFPRKRGEGRFARPRQRAHCVPVSCFWSRYASRAVMRRSDTHTPALKKCTGALAVAFVVGCRHAISASSRDGHLTNSASWLAWHGMA